MSAGDLATSFSAAAASSSTAFLVSGETVIAPAGTFTVSSASPLIDGKSFWSNVNPSIGAVSRTAASSALFIEPAHSDLPRTISCSIRAALPMAAIRLIFCTASGAIPRCAAACGSSRK